MEKALTFLIFLSTQGTSAQKRSWVLEYDSHYQAVFGYVNQHVLPAHTQATYVSMTVLNFLINHKAGK